MSSTHLSGNLAVAQTIVPLVLRLAEAYEPFVFLVALGADVELLLHVQQLPAMPHSAAASHGC